MLWGASRNLILLLAASGCGRIGFGSQEDASPAAETRLRIDNLSRAEALVDFPVMVRLDATRVDYARAGSDGRDIRFRDAATGALLAHEIEAWDPGGVSYVWVRVPSIAASSDKTTIVLAYEPATPAAPPTDVWSNGFVGVYHGAQNFDDSSSGSRHATTTSLEYTGGLAGPAARFSAAAMSHAVLAHDPAHDAIATWSGWLRPETASAGYFALLAHPISAASFDEVLLGTMSASYFVEVTDANDAIKTGLGGPVVLGAWSHIALVVQPGETYRAYVDGQVVSSGVLTAALRDSPSPYFFGADCDVCTASTTVPNSDYVDGAIDEVRLETVPRSAAWLDAHIADMRGQLVIDD